uniref:Uncharacterized protein n=1 Tax=Panagrellus redivivus TaxID=6233 RepID=A0A7E4WC18_PANRE
MAVFRELDRDELGLAFVFPVVLSNNVAFDRSEVDDDDLSDAHGGSQFRSCFPFSLDLTRHHVIPSRPDSPSRTKQRSIRLFFHTLCLSIAAGNTPQALLAPICQPRPAIGRI